MQKNKLRTVVDTNVILAAHTNSVGSPTVELYTRWQREEFILLYSLDILTEYVEKMLDFDVRRQSIKEFVLTLQDIGEVIQIEQFHQRKYPSDKDDVAFLLCAINGGATYLVSYDRHLLDLDYSYDFTICRPIPFLQALRDSLSE